MMDDEKMVKSITFKRRMVENKVVWNNMMKSLRIFAVGSEGH